MKTIIFAAFAVLAGLCSPVFAAAPATGVYKLGNHPDGSAQPPAYGLRLDELINVTAGHDVFTFNFEDPSSNMQLDWNGSTIHISGLAYGGLDTGGYYGNAAYRGLWAIDFLYDTGVSVLANNVTVFSNMVNSGIITSLSGLGSFNLLDKSDGSFAFKLGSENNGSGHRGYNGISGWGWLNHSGAGLGNHVAASDWLFIATPVPEPETWALTAFGLALLGWTRRRNPRA